MSFDLKKVSCLPAKKNTRPRGHLAAKIIEHRFLRLALSSLSVPAASLDPREPALAVRDCEITQKETSDPKPSLALLAFVLRVSCPADYRPPEVKQCCGLPAHTSVACGRV